MTDLTVSRGDVFLFHWNGTDPEPDVVLAALGAEGDAGKLDIFPVSRIAPVGLDGLLIDGHGVDPDEVARSKPALDALDGTIVIAPASAFAEGALLRPVPPATHFATFREIAAPRGTVGPIESDAAKGNLGGLPGKPAKSDARIGGMVALVVLLLLAVFVAFFVLSAG